MGRPARVTREQVLRAAREAFSESGYHGTTLAAIGARVGISPAALLRHAPGKKALFNAAMAPQPGVESLPMDFLRTIDAAGDPRGVLRRLARQFVPFIEEKMAENIVRWMHAKTSETGLTLGESSSTSIPCRPRPPWWPACSPD